MVFQWISPATPPATSTFPAPLDKNVDSRLQQALFFQVYLQDGDGGRGDAGDARCLPE